MIVETFDSVKTVFLLEERSLASFCFLVKNINTINNNYSFINNFNFKFNPYLKHEKLSLKFTFSLDTHKKFFHSLNENPKVEEILDSHRDKILELQHYLCHLELTYDLLKLAHFSQKVISRKTPTETVSVQLLEAISPLDKNNIKTLFEILEFNLESISENYHRKVTALNNTLQNEIFKLHYLSLTYTMQDLLQYKNDSQEEKIQKLCQNISSIASNFLYILEDFPLSLECKYLALGSDNHIPHTKYCQNKFENHTNSLIFDKDTKEEIWTKLVNNPIKSNLMIRYLENNLNMCIKLEDQLLQTINDIKKYLSPKNKDTKLCQDSLYITANNLLIEIREIKNTYANYSPKYLINLQEKDIQEDDIIMDHSNTTNNLNILESVNNSSQLEISFDKSISSTNDINIIENQLIISEALPELSTKDNFDIYKICSNCLNHHPRKICNVKCFFCKFINSKSLPSFFKPVLQSFKENCIINKNWTFCQKLNFLLQNIFSDKIKNLESLDSVEKNIKLFNNDERNYQNTIIALCKTSKSIGTNPETVFLWTRTELHLIKGFIKNNNKSLYLGYSNMIPIIRQFKYRKKFSNFYTEDALKDFLFDPLYLNIITSNQNGSLKITIKNL